MRQLVRKNQFIITALAIMIAVAGYLSYAQKTGEENQYVAANSMEQELGKSLNDISEEDILAENMALTDAQKLEGGLSLTEETSENVTVSSDGTGDMEGNAEEAEEDVLKEIDSLDIDLENVSVTENPGDAVLASGTNNLAMITEIKLNREQVRAANKETLMGIIDNVNIADDQKQEAMNELLESTSISEKEAAAEMLLSAKGFSDVVVSITEDSVDVVVNQNELSDAQRAQIEDIVKRKTEVSAEKIVITPILDTK